MQVAVAGMEDVAHRQAVFRGQRLDAAQHLGQGAARDGAVHAVVVGRQPPHRGKGILAPGPEFLPLGLVAGQADLGGTGGRQQAADALDVGGHVGLHPVQLAEQDGGGIHRVAGVDEVLGGSQGQVVHHLQPTGDDAGGDDVGHRRPGALDVGEAGHHHPSTGRLGQQLDGHLHHDAEQALGTGEQRQQVEAGAVQGGAAQGQAFALQGDDLHRQHVVHGQAVFQAVHATGVLGHVAADGAGDLRRGIGGVVEVVGRRGLGDGQVAHPGLDPGTAALGVHVEDAIEARHHQQHALLQWQGAAGEPGAGTARHQGYVQLMAEAQGRLHLLYRFRQHHQQRRGAIGREAIALIGFEVFPVVQQAVLGQFGTQPLQQLRLVRAGQGAVETFVVDQAHRVTAIVVVLAGKASLYPDCKRGVHGPWYWSYQFLRPLRPKD